MYLCVAHSFFYIEPNSPLKAFLLQSAKMSPEEKAAFLEKDEVIKYCFWCNGMALKELTELNFYSWY